MERQQATCIQGIAWRFCVARFADAREAGPRARTLRSDKVMATGPVRLRSELGGMRRKDLYPRAARSPHRPGRALSGSQAEPPGLSWVAPVGWRAMPTSNRPNGMRGSGRTAECPY